MKTGVIIYVTGETSIRDAYEPSQLAQQLHLNADRVEVIAPGFGHFDISDAWHSLTINGMQCVVCKIAEITGLGEIRLTGRELRLCG